MNASADRFEFTPPPTPGLLRAVGLAILAHACLVAALTWVLHWKQSPTVISVEAELWAAVPQKAAPPPPRPPVPAPVAKPTPPPRVRATPALPDPAIVLERERKRIQKEKQLLADKLEQDNRDKLRKLQQKQQEKQEKQEKQQALDKQRELEEQRELDKRLAADKQKAILEAKRKDELNAEQEASKKLELERKVEVERKAIILRNLQRSAALAGSTGTEASTGTALQSAGPSASYGGRVIARIRPNIVYTETLATNPEALVEVRTDPDGTIVSRKLVKSSGIKSWDDAVLKAIDKSVALPRDTDGRVPPVLEISFRPRD